MQRRFCTGMFIATILGGPSLPGPIRRALAHDLVRRSDPPANGTVLAGAIPVSIAYTGRIDRRRSRLVLLDASGGRRELDFDVLAPPNILRTPAPVELGPGAYVLHWIVLSSDGHLTRGDIRFRVMPADPPNQLSVPVR